MHTGIGAGVEWSFLQVVGAHGKSPAGNREMEEEEGFTHLVNGRSRSMP